MASEQQRDRYMRNDHVGISEQAETSTFEPPLGVPPDMEVSKPVTIGEAMEAVAFGAGDSPVEESDACAIQSAEARAAGLTPGQTSLSATAQAAAAANAEFGTPNAQITLADVLSEATTRLTADKIVTIEDAAKVVDAERRWRPGGDVKEGGVADCMLAAADVNSVISAP